MMLLTPDARAPSERRMTDGVTPPSQQLSLPGAQPVLCWPQCLVTDTTSFRTHHLLKRTSIGLFLWGTGDSER